MLSLILVGVVGLLGPTAATAAPESVEPSKPQDASKASASASAASATRLNPNLARAEDLAALPHVTSELAKSMIDARPFLGMKPLDDFLEGKLTREQRDELYRTMWVPIDLDEATEAEILFIPGVGKRMAHEFEEYRPYDRIERFRREIGKYVDEKEVRRLERYVEIR